MTAKKTILLKGELHNSRADLGEEKALLSDGVDAVVLEGSPPASHRRHLAAWFYVSIVLLTWILESLYQSKEVLVELAAVQGIDVVYTRSDDGVPLADAPTTTKALSAGLFYTLVPGSLWIGFVTDSDLAGSLLLFLGLVLPVLVIRIYNTNRADAARNRDGRIAETITSVGGPGDVVLAVVGAAHLPGVERRLRERDDLTVDVRPPVYDAWSIEHARNVGLPTLKAGFVLFSLYVLCVWIVVRVVAYLSPYVVAVLA